MTTNQLVNIADEVDSELNISDKTAKCSPDWDLFHISAYAYGQNIGKLQRIKVASKESITLPVVGDASASFVFLDKPVTIKGESNGQYNSGMTFINKYNLNLKKGWNEVISVIKEFKPEKIVYEITANIEPTGMKWALFDMNDEVYLMPKRKIETTN